MRLNPTTMHFPSPPEAVNGVTCTTVSKLGHLCAVKELVIPSPREKPEGVWPLFRYSEADLRSCEGIRRKILLSMFTI